MDPSHILNDNSLAIFLFHGVVNNSNYSIRNYTRKHIKKDHFYSFLKSLKKIGHPLSMNEVIHYNEERKPFPEKSFAITFDDGFENNYSIAAPILKDLDISATFYVSTEFIDKNYMSWIDYIEYCFEITKLGKLSLPWERNKFEFKNNTDKIRILDYLRNRVKVDMSIDLNQLVSSIFNQCGVEKINGTDDPLDLKMNWNQIKEINDDENFIIGGHSHKHINLAFLDNQELKYEIETSMKLLEEKSSIKTFHYSYPEGLEYCFSEKVISELKKVGIKCCPTAIHGLNKFYDDLFHLKRIAVIL